MSVVTHDGRALRLLTLIDAFTRECLAIRVARRVVRQELIETLAEVMVARSICAPTMARVHRPGVAEVDGELRHVNAVYRTGKSLGKRLRREFQWEAMG